MFSVAGAPAANCGATPHFRDGKRRMLYGSVARRLVASRKRSWRRRAAAVPLCIAFLGPVSAAATPPPGAHVPGPLRAAAARDGNRVFDVIVQGRPGTRSAAVEAAVKNETAAAARRRFTTISGVATRMTGRQLVQLSNVPGILAITIDAPVRTRDLLPPTVLAPPTVTGTAVEGQVVTALPGSWSGAQPISYAYAWETCDAAGTCTTVAGATGSTLLLPPGSGGMSVRVVVTATDANSATASATSDPVAVQAAEAPQSPPAHPPHLPP